MTKSRLLLLLALAVLLFVGCTDPGRENPRPRSPIPPSSPAAVAPPHCPSRFPPKDEHLKPPKGLSGLASNLVPGHPRVLSLCTFDILRPDRKQSQRQLGRVVIEGRVLDRIVTELDSLKRVTKGVFNCPADLGNRDLLRFAYEDETRLDVVVEFGGCRFASNGASSWFGDIRLLKDLSRLSRRA